ncbi:MAG: OsmC family protein [Pyrinomonadaceae bacterium]
MSEVVYVSKVKIELEFGPARLAHLPAEPQPVRFGVHGAIAEHYKVPPEVADPHATTLDYIVAAAGGCLAGTFGGALEARHIHASNRHLTADVTGEVELEDGVLVIRRIHVAYTLIAPASAREVVERVHRVHAEHCPVYRSLHKAIEITTEYRLREPS